MKVATIKVCLLKSPTLITPLLRTFWRWQRRKTRLSDREALAALEAEQVRFRTKGNKKAVVNIDVISRAFSAGDVVDLPALIARKLVPSSTGHVKVCARGQIDKPLTIKANDFSVIAIKMILLLGGHAIKVK